MRELTFKLVNDSYLYASYYAEDGRVQVPTKKTATREQYEKKSYPKGTLQKLNHIKYLVETYAKNCELADKPVLKSDVIALIHSATGAKVKQKAAGNIHELFTEYFRLISTGELEIKGKKVGKSSLHHAEMLLSHLSRAAIGKKDLEKINLEDFEQFKREINEGKTSRRKDKNNGTSKNTLEAYVQCFLSFMRRTHELLGWHSNMLYTKRGLRVGRESTDKGVYLTVKQIEKIYNAEVHNSIVKTRDLFVIGCYLGLRFVDLNKLTPHHMKNGSLYVIPDKTSRQVVIPLPATAREIWNKYKGVLPTRDRRNFNDRIRAVCKKIAKSDDPCGFDQIHTYVRTEAGEKVTHADAIHEAVSSHTMRRSFATNAFLAGVPTISIMRITGHKTETEFMKYIRISNEQNAEILKEHPFFK